MTEHEWVPNGSGAVKYSPKDIIRWKELYQVCETCSAVRVYQFKNSRWIIGYDGDGSCEEDKND